MPKRKRYRVTGSQAVDGHQPGDEFTAALTADRETYLLAGGHLSIAKSSDTGGKQGGRKAEESTGGDADETSGDDAAQFNSQKE